MYIKPIKNCYLAFAYGYKNHFDIDIILSFLLLNSFCLSYYFELCKQFSMDYEIEMHYKI